MKITIVCVGKIKEKYLRDAISEYIKRLSKYCKLEIIEVVDEKTPDNASEVVGLQFTVSVPQGMSLSQGDICTYPTVIHYIPVFAPYGLLY